MIQHLTERKLHLTTPIKYNPIIDSNSFQLAKAPHMDLQKSTALHLGHPSLQLSAALISCYWSMAKNKRIVDLLATHPSTRSVGMNTQVTHTRVTKIQTKNPCPCNPHRRSSYHVGDFQLCKRTLINEAFFFNIFDFQLCNLSTINSSLMTSFLIGLYC